MSTTTYPLPDVVYSDDVAGRVQRGAALLDQARPGWRTRINPQTLDVACPRGCTIGQEYDGRYISGLYDLELVAHGPDSLDPRFDVDHGFDVSSAAGDLDWLDAAPADVQAAWADADEAEFELLRAAWLVELGAMA